MLKPREANHMVICIGLSPDRDLSSFQTLVAALDGTGTQTQACVPTSSYWDAKSLSQK